MSQQEYRLEVTIKQISDFVREEKKLKTHELVSPFRKEITVYDMAAYQLNEIEGNHLKTTKRIEDAKQQLTVVIQNLADLTKATINEGNFFNIMNEFESKVNNLDNDIRNIKERGEEVREKANKQVENSSPALQNSLRSNVSPIEAVSLLETRLQANDGTQITIEDPDRYILETSQEVSNLKDQLNALAKLAEKKIAINELIKVNQSSILESQKIENLSKESVLKLEENNKNLTQFQEHKKKIQQQKEESIKLFSLTDFRKELTDGEPCPLCGSTSHPYSSEMEIKTDGYDIELKKISKAIEELEVVITESNKKIAAYKATIEQQTSTLNKNKDLLESKQKELANYLSEHQMKEIEMEALQSEMQKVSKALTDKQKSLNDVSEKKEISILLESYKELAEIGKKFSTTRKKREALYTGKSASQICNELQTKFNDCTTSIVTHQQTITNLKMDKHNQTKNINIVKKKLTPLLSQFRLNSLPQLKSLILEKNEMEAIQAKKESLLKERTTVETEIKTIREKLALNKKKDTTEKTLETISIALANNESKREEILTNLGTLNEKINQDKKNRSRVKAFQDELEKIAQEQEKWALLNKLIGDATGNKFANFAQGLTLQNLVVLANKRLDKLSDRYLLTKPESDGLLQIIDRYQGETKRAVSTLSGGESFMVSLALALSLSDMASKNVALDSLFIDEGFGTLDPATLDIAMNTLEKLQTESQKTVGIISHVEALKERIHTQIKLVKNAHGYAKIELVG